tara:strand:- start:72 stop:683 length:612 start_codon:yes stop_codon:yes gene_type:complete
MYNYKIKIKDDFFDNNISKFHPNSIDQHPNFKRFMDKWIQLSLSRHNEFQNKLNIKNKLELNYIGFDTGTNLKTFKKEFYDEDFSTNKIKVVEDKPKEQKAKKAAEQKAKEEKAKKAAEQKAKEQKAKKAAEQKAKEQKAKTATEQKAKEEKAKTEAVQKSVSENTLSVEDIMAKIKELNEMYKSGLISKEEFEMLKNKLLKN